MKHYNIPIFVPHKGCPFDCVFCNQKRITGNSKEVDKATIKNTVEEYLKTLPVKNENVMVEIAFFGGSFTGIDYEMQERFLSTAYEYVKNKKVDGIRVSTRPDYISEEILKLLKKYSVTTIELGVQSLDDEVIAASNRGHTVQDVTEAVRLIKEYGFKLGLQMMTGLPSDTPEKSLATADKIIGLKPDFVRIYPTLVIKDTRLEEMYFSGEYEAVTVEDAVILCKELIKKFDKAHITVIRVALQTTDEICQDGSVVAGPYHPQFRELCSAEIFYDEIREKLIKHKFKKPIVYVNNRDLSKAIGANKRNLERLKKEFSENITVKQLPTVEVGHIEVVESEEKDCI